MNVIVCLKEVPDMEAHFKINSDQTAIETENLIFKMNPFDECAVEEALKLGADAVSIHVNLGNGWEKEMLTDFGRVSYEARTWGIPLLAMIYPRGDKIKNEYDLDVIKHAARVGAEAGADIVKVSYTGSVETFRQVTAGCSVPVVIAGGEKMESDREILEMVKGSIDAGGAGVSIGRNVFQHKDPKAMTQAICAIVHDGASIKTAMKFLDEKQNITGAGYHGIHDDLNPNLAKGKLKF